MAHGAGRAARGRVRARARAGQGRATAAGFGLGAAGGSAGTAGRCPGRHAARPAQDREDAAARKDGCASGPRRRAAERGAAPDRGRPHDRGRPRPSEGRAGRAAPGAGRAAAAAARHAEVPQAAGPDQFRRQSQGRRPRGEEEPFGRDAVHPGQQRPGACHPGLSVPNLRPGADQPLARYAGDADRRHRRCGRPPIGARRHPPLHPDAHGRRGCRPARRTDSERSRTRLAAQQRPRIPDAG